MKDEMQHSEGQPSDLEVDIEGLLTAIQARTSGEIREYKDQDQQPRLNVESQVFHSCTELAEAFEIDISNYRA